MRRTLTLTVNHRSLLLLAGFCFFTSCSIPGLHLDKYTHPVKRFFNKEKNYWVDLIEYEGDTGIEAVYYKDGRPALERFFDENDLLKTISYYNRGGELIRLDSLVYSEERTLIAGYYFSMPEHRQILKFLNYKQQGQLSQRSWFGSVGELLGREFFLFDAAGNRRMRMVFNELDTLLLSETYQPGSEIQLSKNVYRSDGVLKSQVNHLAEERVYQYDMSSEGTITRISQLQETGTPHWSSDLFYDQDGSLARSNFSTDGRILFSYTGDLEFRKNSVRTWKHPMTPTVVPRSMQIAHRDPFSLQSTTGNSGELRTDYYLPVTGALFKTRVQTAAGLPLTDTLYSSQSGLQPALVVNYDSLGLVDHELSYDFSGNAKWRYQLFRDDRNRVIREEIIELPNTFSEAVTRFYDFFNNPALSEHFSRPDSFDGSWLYYHGGGIKKILYYKPDDELAESWLVRPAGDTVRHSRFKQVDYITIESKYSADDQLLSQRRFSDDGKMNWELHFDENGQLKLETHRKMDGVLFKEVSYDAEKRTIKSSTYGPVDLEALPPGAELKGDLSSQLVTRVNKSGEIIHVISMSSSGEREWERRFAYRKGKLLRSAQLGADGVPQLISNYEYTDKGQISRESAFSKEDSLVHTIDFRYDDAGELILKTFTSNVHKRANSNRLYYDEAGRVSRDEIIENQRFIEAVNYTYFPDFFVRVATYVDPEGNELRKEIENYFGDNVFDFNTEL